MIRQQYQGPNQAQQPPFVQTPGNRMQVMASPPRNFAPQNYGPQQQPTRVMNNPVPYQQPTYPQSTIQGQPQVINRNGPQMQQQQVPNPYPPQNVVPQNIMRQQQPFVPPQNVMPQFAPSPIKNLQMLNQPPFQQTQSNGEPYPQLGRAVTSYVPNQSPKLENDRVTPQTPQPRQNQQPEDQERLIQLIKENQKLKEDIGQLDNMIDEQRMKLQQLKQLLSNQDQDDNYNYDHRL